MELPSEDVLIDRLVSVIRDYSHHGNATISGDDQFHRWVFTFVTLIVAPPPFCRNYLAQPASQQQYETVMKYLQDRNFSSIRPHGGVVFNKLVIM